MSDSEKTLAARVAAHESWAYTPDRTARTAAGRAAFEARFELMVDPTGVLPAAERSKRAAHARKAYFQRLALASARSRRLARSLTITADQADAELKAAGDRDAG